MTTTRRTASIVLALAGALVFLLGGLFLYARAAIFNSDAFADRATETLVEERVQEALTEPIVNAIVDSGPAELINAQPILEAGVGGVIDSSAFRGIFHDAVRRAHAALFEGDVEALALNLADAGVIAIEAVRSISPEIARDIPEDLEPELIQITESDATLAIADVTHDVREAAIVLPLLGLVLLGGSVAVAPTRRTGLIRAAVALAVGSGIVLALVVIARAIVLGQFEDPLVHDAVAAAWGAFLGDLLFWFGALGAGAVIVAAAAYAGVRRVDPAAPFRRLATVGSWRPERSSVRLLRAAVIFAVSVLLVLEPQLVLQIAVIALGGWGLFIAATEILLVVAPPPEVQPGGERQAGKGPLRRIRPAGATVALSALAAIVLVVVLVSGGDEDGVAERPAGAVVACNGYPELCERTVDQVAFAATHNSMSAAREPDWYLPNQRFGIPTQLEDGIRAFLIDTHYGIETSGGTVVTDFSQEPGTRDELVETIGEEGLRRVERIRERVIGEADPDDARPYLCHVACELGATELSAALTGVREFLDSHPDELVILFVEDVVTPQDAAQAFDDSGILHYAYVHRRGEPFPTLRELIESDRRVLILGETHSGGSTLPWYHDGFSLVQETPYTFGDEDEISSRAGCRPNRGTEHSPMFQINNWIERIPRSPDEAGRVNRFDTLLARVRMCERIRGLLPNLIAVDHYDRGDIFGVVNVLNGLDRTVEPQVRSLR